MEWPAHLALSVIWAVLVLKVDLSAVEGYLYEAINQYSEVWKSHLYPFQVYADREGYRTADTTAKFLNPEFVERAESGCNVLMDLVAQAIWRHRMNPLPSNQHVDILGSLLSIGVPHWIGTPPMLDIGQLPLEPAWFYRLQAVSNKLAHLGHAIRRLEACHGLMVSIDTIFDNTCPLKFPIMELIRQHLVLEVSFAGLEGIAHGWRTILSRNLQNPPSTFEPVLRERLVSILKLLDQIEATWVELAESAKGPPLNPIVAEKLALFAFGRDTSQPFIPSWWGARDTSSTRPSSEKHKSILRLFTRLPSHLQAILAVVVSKYQSMVTYKDLMMMELLQRWAVSDPIPDLTQSVSLQQMMSRLSLAVASLKRTENVAAVALQRLLASLPGPNAHLVPQPGFSNLEGAYPQITADLKTYEHYCFAVLSLVNNLLALRGFRRDMLLDEEGSCDDEVKLAIKYILSAAQAWEITSITLCQSVRDICDVELKYFILERIWTANHLIVHAAGLRFSLGLPSAAISGRSAFLVNLSDSALPAQPLLDSALCKRHRSGRLEAPNDHEGSPSHPRKRRAFPEH